jgi:hypothetical protein
MCSRLTVIEKTEMLRAISTRRCRAAYIGDLAQRRDTETSTMVAIAPTFSTPLRGVSLRLAWFGSDTLAACHISEGFDVARSLFARAAVTRQIAPQDELYVWQSARSRRGAHRRIVSAFDRLGLVSEPGGRTRPGLSSRGAERQRGQVEVITSCAIRRLSRRR